MEVRVDLKDNQKLKFEAGRSATSWFELNLCANDGTTDKPWNCAIFYLKPETAEAVYTPIYAAAKHLAEEGLPSKNDINLFTSLVSDQNECYAAIKHGTGRGSTTLGKLEALEN